MPTNFQHLANCVDAILSATLYRVILRNHLRIVRILRILAHYNIWDVKIEEDSYGVY